MVVFDVARAGVPTFRFRRFLATTTLELRQNRFIRHVDHVRQHVESAAMCHADDRFCCPMRRRELECEIEHRHSHVETFDRKTLLTEVSLVQEALEGVDGRKTSEQMLLALGG